MRPFFVSFVFRLAIAMFVAVTRLNSCAAETPEEQHIGYFDAYFANAYAAEAFDVSYSIDYSAKPTKEDAAFVPKDVELSKQLRGRQVFNRAEGKLLWVEEMVELTPSLQLRSNDSENKNLLAHVVVRVIKDGELQFRKIGQAAPLMSFSGAFGELLEKGAVRALPLVPTSGWNATYKATDIEGERGLLNAFGIAKARRDIGDQFVVEFTKEDVMQDGRAVYFIKEFSFDERNLRLVQGVQRRGVEGQSLRSADRFHISYEDFNGVDLPVSIEISTFTPTDAFGEVVLYDELRKVKLQWRSVNRPDEIKLPAESVLLSADKASAFIDSKLD